jgi:sugar phosphate isomerase/epimerase
MRRREFLFHSLAVAAAAAAGRVVGAAGSLKFGHRQANMVSEPGPAVFDLAKLVGGLSGVELQVYFKGTTLCDPGTLSGYRSAAERAGVDVPSLAGVWPPGAGLMQPGADEHLRKAIGAAASLRATTILVASFDQNCPRMDQESSYGPAVALLQSVSAAASDAGVTIGLETSNAPSDDRKLVDLVDRASVKVYYDLDNVEKNGHVGAAVPGIALLQGHIRQVHLKNGDRLLEEPGRVRWIEALKGLAAAGYCGWFVFETPHASPQQCIEATRKNIAFVARQLAS